MPLFHYLKNIYFICSYFSTDTKHSFGIKRAHLYLTLSNTLSDYDTEVKTFPSIKHIESK